MKSTLMAAGFGNPLTKLRKPSKTTLKNNAIGKLQWLLGCQKTSIKVNPKTGERHEPPCLSLIDTEILDGQMHLTCYFRSWDAYAGLPANIAGLQLFNEAFVSEINERGNLSLKTGKLIFHSKNCHIYKRQFNLVKELLEPKDKPSRMALGMQESKKE